MALVVVAVGKEAYGTHKKQLFEGNWKKAVATKEEGINYGEGWDFFLADD